MIVSLLHREKSSEFRTGVDRYYDELIVQYLNRNVEIDLYCLQKADRTVIPPAYREEVNLFSLEASRRMLFSGLLFKGLREISAKLKQHCGIVHSLLPMPIKVSHPEFVTIFTIHDLTPLIIPEAFSPYAPFLFRKTLKSLAKSNCYFIANSECTKADLQNFFAIDPDRIFVTPLGVNDTFTPQSGAAVKAVKQIYHLPPRYFLFTGAMNKRKNLDRVVDAFLAFKRRQPNDLKLVLAGRMNWGGSEIEKKIIRSGLKDEVILPGYLPEADLPAVVAGAEAMIYVSLYEGFGFPVLEAMKAGTPVIASNVSSIPEVAGDAALLVDPYDTGAIADAMMQVAGSMELRQTLIRKGFRQAEKFSWEKTAEETIKVYQTLLDKKNIPVS